MDVLVWLCPPPHHYEDERETEDECDDDDAADDGEDGQVVSDSAGHSAPDSGPGQCSSHEDSEKVKMFTNIHPSSLVYQAEELGLAPPLN